MNNFGKQEADSVCLVGWTRMTFSIHGLFVYAVNSDFQKYKYIIGFWPRKHFNSRIK